MPHPPAPVSSRSQSPERTRSPGRQAQSRGRGKNAIAPGAGWWSPLDAVKKHVSHVLGKLGAANRTEAVTRARQLGLIR